MKIFSKKSLHGYPQVLDVSAGPSAATRARTGRLHLPVPPPEPTRPLGESA
jgi:hypothetical protein